MKRKMRGILRKSAAAVSASVLVLSLPVTASADGTAYCEREKEALKAACESLAEEWDKSLETSLKEDGSLASDAVMDINLTVEEC